MPGLEPKRGHHVNAAIAIVVSVQLMIIVDGTITNIALPVLQHDLGFSTTALAWVGNTFALAFGGLLLLAGRVGDVVGRRRVFSWGALAFAAASVICGVAQDETVLLIGRTLQGVASAFASSAALALIITTFEEGRERTKAMTAYAGVSSIGGAFGMVLGGVILDYASWRWAFFINIPIAIAAAILTPLYLGEPERHSGQFDVSGALTSVVGMSSLVYGLINAASEGWQSVTTMRAFALALIALIAFFHVERRAEQPLVPFGLFADRTRCGAYIGRMCIIGAMMGSFFFMSQYLQVVRGYTPLQNGLALLPNTLAVFAGAKIAGSILPRLGTRVTALIGLPITTLGFVLLTQLGTHTAYLGGMGLPLTMTGFGIGFPMMSLTMASMANVSARDSGSASSMLNVVQQIGGALGLAILVTVFGSASRHYGNHHAPGTDPIAFAHRVFVHGLDAAFWGAVGFGTLAIALVATVIRNPRPADATPERPVAESVAAAEGAVMATHV